MFRLCRIPSNFKTTAHTATL